MTPLYRQSIPRFLRRLGRMPKRTPATFVKFATKTGNAPCFSRTIYNFSWIYTLPNVMALNPDTQCLRVITSGRSLRAQLDALRDRVRLLTEDNSRSVTISLPFTIFELRPNGIVGYRNPLSAPFAVLLARPPCARRGRRLPADDAKHRKRRRRRGGTKREREGQRGGQQGGFRREVGREG
jgi:hypothetical protein